MIHASLESFSGQALKGLVALVTGANRGIGKAIADGFELCGARVWRHARASHRVESGRWLFGDLSSPAKVEDFVREFQQAESTLHVLVNNAGVELDMPLDRPALTALDETLLVNLRAPVQLVTSLLPQLTAAGAASVINVTSIHESVPYPGNSAYCMSKAALAMFTRTASIELASRGIRVNNLAPGAIATDINREVLEKIGVARFAEWIPAGRVGELADVVGPAVFLASGASRYVTGTTLVADGGYGRNVVRY